MYGLNERITSKRKHKNFCSENDNQLQAKNTGKLHAEKCGRRVELGWVTQDEGEQRFK